MEWEEIEKSTNDEYDMLRKNVLVSDVQSIARSMRLANAIVCYRFLWGLGAICGRDYAYALSQILDLDGFKGPSKDDLIRKFGE